MIESDDARLIRLKEQYRCEKILLNYLRKYADDFGKQRLLKSVLSRIRKQQKEKVKAHD